MPCLRCEPAKILCKECLAWGVNLQKFFVKNALLEVWTTSDLQHLTWWTVLPPITEVMISKHTLTLFTCLVTLFLYFFFIVFYFWQFGQQTLLCCLAFSRVTCSSMESAWSNSLSFICNGIWFYLDIQLFLVNMPHSPRLLHSYKCNDIQNCGTFKRHLTRSLYTLFWSFNVLHTLPSLYLLAFLVC